MGNPLYVGVFLTPESREKLLSFVPPLYKDVIAHHMTVMFNPYELLVENLDLGKKVKLRVIGHAFDDKVQAVNVLGFLSSNHNAHITISVNRDKGGRPNDSNEMLKKAFQEDKLQLAQVNIDLEGVLDVFPRSTNSAVTHKTSILKEITQWLKNVRRSFPFRPAPTPTSSTPPKA